MSRRLASVALAYPFVHRSASARSSSWGDGDSSGGGSRFFVIVVCSFLFARWRLGSRQDIDSSRKVTFDDLNNLGQGTELKLPFTEELPIDSDENGNFIEFLTSDVCMMPYVNTMGKKLEENDLDGAIMMGLPCIESDDDNYGNFNLQLWLVDSPTVQ